MCNMSVCFEVLPVHRQISDRARRMQILASFNLFLGGIATLRDSTVAKQGKSTRIKIALLEHRGYALLSSKPRISKSIESKKSG